MKGTFVFVVCGAAEHIHTLHFSLKALRKFSCNHIIVITDYSRNAIPIQHENVIDVKTPEHYNHHQASIFLKTGIYKYLPKGYLYCYLDTDVVAINEQVGDIFNYKTSIINFASDHCKVQKFSPYALNCGCKTRNDLISEELQQILLKYKEKIVITEPVLLEKQRRLVKKLSNLKSTEPNYFLTSLRFIFSINKFKLDDDTYFLRWERVWVDKQGNVILLDRPKKVIATIERRTGWKWNDENRTWRSPSGEDPNNLWCNHLTEAISQKFNIPVENRNWQHWNGGVFLFDDDSIPFLESWHSKTLAIFEDPFWKTRDQGTLIATAWEFRLQDIKTLPVEFNFLADYNHQSLQYLQNFTFSFENPDKKFKPCLLHIYHHWGNTEWDVWKDTAALVLD